MYKHTSVNDVCRYSLQRTWCKGAVAYCQPTLGRLQWCLLQAFRQYIWHPHCWRDCFASLHDQSWGWTLGHCQRHDLDSKCFKQFIFSILLTNFVHCYDASWVLLPFQEKVAHFKTSQRACMPLGSLPIAFLCGRSSFKDSGKYSRKNTLTNHWGHRHFKLRLRKDLLILMPFASAIAPFACQWTSEGNSEYSETLKHKLLVKVHCPHLPPECCSLEDPNTWHENISLNVKILPQKSLQDPNPIIAEWISVNCWFAVYVCSRRTVREKTDHIFTFPLKFLKKLAKPNLSQRLHKGIITKEFGHLLVTNILGKVIKTGSHES